MTHKFQFSDKIGDSILVVGAETADEFFDGMVKVFGAAGADQITQSYAAKAESLALPARPPAPDPIGQAEQNLAAAGMVPSPTPPPIAPGPPAPAGRAPAPSGAAAPAAGQVEYRNVGELPGWPGSKVYVRKSKFGGGGYVVVKVIDGNGQEQKLQANLPNGYGVANATLEIAVAALRGKAENSWAFGS